MDHSSDNEEENHENEKGAEDGHYNDNDED